MCIHGGTPIDCKKCNNPYKSVLREDNRLSWKKIKNEGIQSDTYYTKSAIGYSQETTIDLK